MADPTVPREYGELPRFAEELRRKSQAVEAARLSFEQRVREFLEERDFDRSPPSIQRIQVALDEYDRVRKSRATTGTPAAEPVTPTPEER